MLEEPLALAVRTDDPALYIAEKGGRVVAIRDGEVDPTPVLDVSNEVSLGGEQGLLGLAFSPDGGTLYVNFTDVNGDTRVVAYAMAGDRADPSSRREVLFVDQPYSNHNGGNLVFGPGRVPLYRPRRRRQRRRPARQRADRSARCSARCSGSIRDPPTARRTGSRPTTRSSTTPGALPEIWAYGLRNPWRYSFDRATGDLWIGDVGQSAWEEVDRQPASSTGGENYGWNVREGSHPYAAGGSAPGAVDPVFDYAHSDGGCVVTGGYVYRGAAIPDLVGTYVFADFCVGALEGLRLDGDEGRPRTAWGDRSGRQLLRRRRAGGAVCPVARGRRVSPGARLSAVHWSASPHAARSTTASWSGAATCEAGIDGSRERSMRSASAFDPPATTHRMCRARSSTG